MCTIHSRVTGDKSIHNGKGVAQEVAQGRKYEGRSLWLEWCGQGAGVRTVGKVRSWRSRASELGGVYVSAKSDGKPWEILGQGDNTICFGGKLDFLNSVKEILNKPLYGTSLNLLLLPLPGSCISSLCCEFCSWWKATKILSKSEGRGENTILKGLGRLNFFFNKKEKPNFQGVAPFPYTTSNEQLKQKKRKAHNRSFYSVLIFRQTHPSHYKLMMNKEFDFMLKNKSSKDSKL